MSSAEDSPVPAGEPSGRPAIRFKKARSRSNLRVRDVEPTSTAGSTSTAADDAKPDESEDDLAHIEEMSRETKERQRARMRGAGLASENLLVANAAQKEEVKDDALTSLEFTKQTNALDVNKHLAAFVEREMRLRRGQADPEALAQEAALANRPADPITQLYRTVAEANISALDKNNLINEANGAARDAQDDEEVGISASMLTAVAEVDLGIENKLLNIERTEAAQQRLMSASSNFRQRPAAAVPAKSRGRKSASAKEAAALAEAEALATSSAGRYGVLLFFLPACVPRPATDYPFSFPTSLSGLDVCVCVCSRPNSGGRFLRTTDLRSP
ncbi:hypothetical protein, variant 1 [Fonticula alba]|uniref:Uncharacterized protein n=1 Tax=Fonticula alba TaxID=691883 RepID=A0A058ZHK3_FONAL|nr:hypothetical protein, variant 1 [Fonticula alba]KCV73446.1 hypothetical protein, variant 1 [Fonticula alba]|eukprot:XP_009493148.1 hypothetical protein, variant 1 [Fonticula alba]